jgi:hypothetical protein
VKRRVSLHILSRRLFFKYSFCISSLSLAVSLSCGFNKKTAGIRYLDSLCHALKEIRNKEETRLRDVSNLFAQTLINRNRCFLAISDPMNPGYYTEEKSSLPPVFILIRSLEMAVTIREGDALLTTNTGDIPGLAKKRGATVVELPGALRIRTLSDAGPVHLAIITALAGEIYRRSEGVNRTGNLPPTDALRFLDTVESRLQKIKKQREDIYKAALLIGEKIHHGGDLWLYDKSGAFAREISAGHIPGTNPRIITPEGITGGHLKDKDALVFMSLE